MPDSWYSALYDKIDTILRNLYQGQVLDGFQKRLQQKGREITTLPAAEEPKIPDGAAEPPEGEQLVADRPLEQSPEFIELRNFTQQIKEYKEAVDHYNEIGLPQRGEVADLIAILKYLYPGSEQGIEDKDSVALREIVQQTQGKAVLVNSKPASEKFKRLVDNLFTVQIENSILKEDVEDLSAALEGLETHKLESYEDLKNLLDGIARTDRDLRNPSITWVFNEHLMPPPPVQSETQELIQLFPKLDPELTDYVRDAAESRRGMVRNQIMSSEVARSAAPVLDWKGGSPELTADIRALRVALENALQLPFMAAATSGARLDAQIPSGESVFWNKAPLDDALGMSESYRRYLQESLTNAPANLRATMQRITLARLDAAMSDQIVQAGEVRPSLPASDSAPEPDEMPEAKSFQQAAGSLRPPS